jgi:histidinol-phosphate phosphatase family protein
MTNGWGKVMESPSAGIPGIRSVFLDRDGVLNEKMPEGRYVTRPEEFRVLPGVAQAIRRLNEAGLGAVVVTNQRGIARGLYTLEDLEAIHAELQRILTREGAHIDGFFVCPHDEHSCNCRKPLPGLFEQAASKFPEITAATSAMIGDSLVDIEFGRRLRMKTIYIEGDTIESSAQLRRPIDAEAAKLADWRFASLPLAVDAILAAGK